MCVCISSTHTQTVKRTTCSILRVISGYWVLLTSCTAWENPKDLVAWFPRLWDDSSCGEQLSYETLPLLLWPSPSFRVPCIRLSLPPPLLFSSPSSFLPSLSGRATRGGPSQPSPEPAGTRGSSGCNSESMNSENHKRLFKEMANSAAEFFFTALSVGFVCFDTHWDDDGRAVRLSRLGSEFTFTIFYCVYADV